MSFKLDQSYSLLQIHLSLKTIVFSMLGDRAEVLGQLQQSY